jgi:aminodeoxyfutalosine deaminase
MPQVLDAIEPSRLDPSIFIRRLPKAELHLHLEGSVDAPTLVELSRRHASVSCPELTLEEVAKLYDYEDFNGFLLAFKTVTERLRTAEDFDLITYNLVRNLHAQNVLHAEVFVSVGVVLWRKQEFAPLFAGMDAGRKRAQRDFGTSLLWIFDAVRHFGPQEGRRVVELAAANQDRGVVGFGIGGDERRGPADTFRDVFALAKNYGLHLTAHAGENIGPESIWAAMNIGAERIGHGLAISQDPELQLWLRERQTAIECCVTSNVRTSCCRHWNEHPVKRMFDAGLMVTLNTDDPAMFRTTLNQEYQLAHEVFGFTEEQLREIARNSFEASFLPAEQKVQFLNEIDALR